MTKFVLISRSWDLLSKVSRRQLIASSLFQSVLAIFDVVGIALMGVIGTVGLNYVSGIAIPKWMESYLNYFFGTNYKSTDVLLALSIAAAVLFLTKSILGLSLSYQIALKLAKEQTRVSKIFVENLTQVDYKWLRKQDKQGLIYAATDGINAIFLGVLTNAVIIISDSVLLILISISLIVIDPGTALMTILLFGVIAFGLQRIIGDYLETQGRKITKSAIAGRDELDNFFYAYKEVTVLRRQDVFLDEFKAQRSIYSSAYARNSWAQLIPKYVIEIGMILGASLIIGYQVFSSTAAESLSTLLIFISAASRLTPALLRIQSSILYIRNSQAMATVTFDFLAQMAKLNVANRRLPLVNPPGKYSKPVQIEVCDLFFSFPDESLNVLNKISMSIQPGEVVAIVGHSGAGKSTFLDLMLGIMEPTKGKIEINGIPVNQWLDSNSNSVAYVQQQPYIYNRSFIENITLEPENVVNDPSELERILETTGLKKLRNVFGQNGNLQNLSGGEKQRLALARAMYLKPSLLVIDEGTSSLDAISEKTISDAIFRLKGFTTTVIVAHRLSSIRDADKIFYLSNGTIASTGTFDELYSSNVQFQSLVKTLTV